MTQLPKWLQARWRRLALELATMPLGRRVIRGAAASLVMTAASMLLGVTNSVLLGRSLGPEQFGLYSFVLIVVGLVTVPFWYGMSVLLTRETARMAASGTRGQMGDLLGWSFGWAARAIVAVTALAAVMLWLLSGWLGPGRTAVCLVGLPFIALSIVQPLNSSLLRGLGGLVRSQFADLVARPAMVLLGLLLVLGIFGRHFMTAQSGLAISMLAMLIGTGLSGYWLIVTWQTMRLAARRGAEPYLPSYRFRNLLAFSAVAVLSALYGSIDTLMLDRLDGDAALGVYRIAMTALQLVNSLVAAINTITQPSVASLHIAGDQGRLQRLLTANSRATLALVAVPAAVLILFGAPLLRVVFGEAFVAGAPALAIGAAGQLVTVLAGPVWNVLSMTGHERSALRFLLIATVSNFALCALLIPAFGMTGAAIGTAAGNIVFVSLMSFNERRLAGVTSSVFGVRRS